VYYIILKRPKQKVNDIQTVSWLFRCRWPCFTLILKSKIMIRSQVFFYFPVCC